MRPGGGITDKATTLIEVAAASVTAAHGAG